LVTVDEVQAVAGLAVAGLAAVGLAAVGLAAVGGQTGFGGYLAAPAM
jgi:hypothetical protein